MTKEYSDLLDTAFVAPDGHNATQIQDLFEAATRRLVAHLASAEQRAPMPHMGHALDIEPWAVEPASDDVLLDALASLLDQCMNQANPAYMGHMDPMPSTWSIIGELMAAGVNNNMLSVEMSPSLSQLEYRLMRHLAQFFGLGDSSGGVMVNGGTLANLQALTVARNHLLDVHKQGLNGIAEAVIVLASDDAHVSIQKAAMILGLGTQNVRSVKVDAYGRMSVEDLRRKLQMARQDGHQVVAIVATAGATTTGAIDPLSAIADLAQEYNVWLHVDAAYSGALQFSAKHRHKLHGIERADSITFNPQKWLYVSRTCVVVLFRRMSDLFDDFRIGAPYMDEYETAPNLGELSVQGTRSTDVLKLWLSLRHFGLSGCEQLVNRGCELAQYLARQIKKRASLEMATAVDSNLLCFRSHPTNVEVMSLDDRNRRLNTFLRTKGFFVSLPTYRGSAWQRVVVLNPYTNESHLDALIKAIDDFHAQDDEP